MAQAEPKNVERRVGVAVSDQPAMMALVGPLRERLGDHSPAARASLRGPTGRHLDQLSTSFCRFVLEQFQEGCPALVRHVLREKSLGKSTDVEILESDQTELNDESSRQLVGMVAPEVPNALML